MRQPKRMWAPLKPKAKKEKSPKKEKPTGKGKKKEPDNEEYLALMEVLHIFFTLQARQMKINII